MGCPSVSVCGSSPCEGRTLSLSYAKLTSLPAEQSGGRELCDILGKIIIRRSPDQLSLWKERDRLGDQKEPQRPRHISESNSGSAGKTF